MNELKHQRSEDDLKKKIYFYNLSFNLGYECVQNFIKILIIWFGIYLFLPEISTVFPKFDLIIQVIKIIILNELCTQFISLILKKIFLNIIIF